MTRTISVGKYRGLQQCSTSFQTFTILALDHRNNLRTALNPQAPGTVPDDMLVEFKRQVTSALSPAATAVLLDPEFGAAQCIVCSALPGSTGLVLAVESTGYNGDPQARQSQVLPGWTIAKSRRMGASGVKLLVYYHPDAPTAAQIEELVKQVADDCAHEELPLFLEPLSYSLDPNVKKLPPEERRRVVVETARRLTIPGVDVLKAEFPLDIAAQPDEREWEAACAELSAASQVPWVLLSASVDFETYLHQVTAACRGGASGIAVGRAVWQEALQLSGDDRLHFLNETALYRLKKLHSLVDGLASQWTGFFTPPETPFGWYVNY